jgi:hypothetical protein
LGFRVSGCRGSGFRVWGRARVYHKKRTITKVPNGTAMDEWCAQITRLIVKNIAAEMAGKTWVQGLGFGGWVWRLRFWGFEGFEVPASGCRA